MKSRRYPASRSKRMGGVVLIEVLVAALIFALGILGMVGVSAIGTGVQTEARNRTEASSLANDLAQLIWLNVDRTSTATIQASLATFQHQPTEDTLCQFTGNGASNAEMTTWLTNNWNTNIRDNASASMNALVGATPDRLSVQIGTGATDFNRVTITMCWDNPGDPANPRRHRLETWVN